MKTRKPKNTKITPTIPDFLRAILSELKRVIGDDPAGWTVTKRLPAVVQAAQLCVFGRLILSGITPTDAYIYPHKAKLNNLLDTAGKKSRQVWVSGRQYLNDIESIRPNIRAAVKFAECNFGLGKKTLGALGIVDAQDTLALLIGRISKAMAAKLTANTKRGEQVPEAVHAAVGLGMLAGGLAGRRKMIPKEVAVARFIASRGSKKDARVKREPKEIKQIRKTLKELDVQLTPKKTPTKKKTAPHKKRSTVSKSKRT